MLKNVFYVALVVGIFVACAGVKAQPSFSAPDDKGVISLNISDKKDSEPDTAMITFAVETTANTAKEVSAENNEISAKVINSLKAIIDSKTDMIKTTDYSIRPNYVYIKDEPRKVRNYTAYNSVVVKTKDLTKVSKLIDVAVANGANRTDNLSYSFENPEELCNSAYPDMVKKLKMQADTIAKAAGSSVVGIKFINANCNSSGGGYVGRKFFSNAVSMDEAASAPSAPVEAGKVKVNISVSAEFYVK